jgi:WD40 repeat protein
MFLTLKENCQTTTVFEDDVIQVLAVVKIECMLNNVWINLLTALFVAQVISGHLGWVRCIAVEPGNQWFVTGSADRTIKVYKGNVGCLP